MKVVGYFFQTLISLTMCMYICLTEREKVYVCVSVCGYVYTCVGVPVEASHYIKYPRVGVNT